MPAERSAQPGPVRFAVLTDLHLSDVPGTAAAAALDWAVAAIGRERPDFVAVAGDATTVGTAASTARFLAALEQVEVPVLFTPGNAELRTGEGISLLQPLTTPQRRQLQRHDLSILLPDTSSGTLPAAEREWLARAVRRDGAGRRIVITHYPLDVMEAESAAWLLDWMTASRVELLVAGHRHFARRRQLGATIEVVCRGLDPDKAIGGLPGLSLFASAEAGEWSETLLPWSPALQLLPSDVAGASNPVGWSIHGDPVAAARETADSGLFCLELRPRDHDFSRPALREEVKRLRDRGPLYLSYHLPNLAWDRQQAAMKGEDEVRIGVDLALELGVDSLTMHTPRARAAEMLGTPEEPGTSTTTELHAAFLDLYVRLFGAAVESGVRLAVENVHNPANTPADSPGRDFATRIDEYGQWISALRRALPDAGAANVGALFDVGHARNNGGELDNLQPLGDWYAAIGGAILGYHIHQVGRHPDTGKPVNHREITGLYGKRISFVGFLWAWSARQIARAPLFVEVRQPEERRRTAALLKDIFDRAAEITRGLDLPAAPAD